MPFIVAWAVWVTSAVFSLNAWMSLGPRFTPDKADAMETRIVAGTDRKIELLAKSITDGIGELKLELAAIPKESPPKWWEAYVREQLLDLNTRVKNWRKQMPTSPNNTTVVRKDSTLRLWLYVVAASLTVLAPQLETVQAGWQAWTTLAVQTVLAGVVAARSYLDQTPSRIEPKQP